MGKVCVPLNEDLLKVKSLSMRVLLYILDNTELTDNYNMCWTLDAGCLKRAYEEFSDMSANRVRKSIDKVISLLFHEDWDGNVVMIEGRLRKDYVLVYMNVGDIWKECNDIECNVLMQMCLMTVRNRKPDENPTFSLTSLTETTGYTWNNSTMRNGIEESLKSLKAKNFIKYGKKGNKNELLSLRI